MTNIVNNPRNYYDQQSAIFANNLAEVKRKIRLISVVRIIVFLATVVGIYIAVANGQEIIAIICTSGFGFFIYLVKVHGELDKKKEWNKALLKINQDELLLLNGKTNNMDTGEEYLYSSHPYNEDLDIFGNRSLFQLINRTATKYGRTKLAEKLNKLSTDIDILKIRQTAISELSGKHDWRQNFLAIGRLFNEKNEDLQELITWSKTTESRFNSLFYRTMLIVTPILGFGILALIEFEITTISTFLIFLLLPLIIIGTKLGILNKIHVQVSKKSGLLIKYSKLFALITGEEFNSNLLNDIKENVSGDHSARKAVGTLAKITKSMDYRLNMLVGIFLNVFFLWDIKQVIRIEKWKTLNAEFLENWFFQLSLIDELQSFAGFKFNFPNSVFPEFNQNDFEVNAINVNHPFISKTHSVGNEIHVDGWRQFQIITGANMAGKSTYLRTIGVNMVLAMTGSTVLADSFSIKPVGIFTGIKTTDSLQDGESYFFAELKRLKELIDYLESGQKLFVILDEVLRGTNSADKQKGSMALITQLINLSSSGMIATHDLALGGLAEKFPGNVTNKRFEVEIDNNELVFDYKLKEGISENLNATFLMKKMGITI